ncbi:MAG: AraC family transcriptional regulator [Candidatus Aminicenantes bacterium]|nr:AraC family transcriptional regulator [Candidatus Aminicenantes bacterium]
MGVVDHKIDAIIVCIQNNFTKQITLKELSEACEVNYCYLSSVFKKKVGVSFPKYVKSLRIKSAQALLKEGLKEIKEVAYESGDKSLTHFYIDFKSYVGMSPKEYIRINHEVLIQNYVEKIERKLKESK